MVLSSIVVLQILAYLPLTDIRMSANVLQPFQIMAEVVSFDFFEPFEYIDVNLTDFDPWSPNFGWLGFQSTNFLLALGSIFIFAAIEVINVLLSVLLIPCLHRIPIPWVRKFFSTNSSLSSALTFIHGTFFEIMVCAATSTIYVEFWDMITRPDKLSLVIGMIIIIMLCCYLFLGFYFFLIKAGDFVLKQREKIEEKNFERCDFIHKSLIFQAKARG